VRFTFGVAFAGAGDAVPIHETEPRATLVITLSAEIMRLVRLWRLVSVCLCPLADIQLWKLAPQQFFVVAVENAVAGVARVMLSPLTAAKDALGDEQKPSTKNGTPQWGL